MATCAVSFTNLVNGDVADAVEINTNYDDIVDFFNASVLHRDGTKSMTALLELSSDNPTENNEAVRKAYMDGPYVEMLGGGVPADYTANTITPVLFWTAVDDPLSAYNQVAGGIIVPRAGIWYVAWGSLTPAGGTAKHHMGVRLISTATKQFAGPQFVPNELGSEDPSMTMAVAVKANVGDYIQATMSVDSTVTRDFAGWFTATWLHG